MTESLARESTPRSGERRTQFLEVALKLFAEKGYHDTSIADIIQAAGVARGTFYNYFQNKREIFDQLLDGLFHELFSVAFPIDPSSDESVADQVRRMIRAVSGKMLENPELTRIVLEKAGGLDDEARVQLQAFYSKIFNRIKGAIEDGQRMGILRRGDSAVITACVLGALKEPAYQVALGTVKLEPEHIVSGVFDILSGGLLAR